jgi:hypothetical protein
MSASNKFLIFAVVLLVSVIGYLAVDHLARAPMLAPQQAAPQSPSPASATPSPSPAPAAATAQPPAPTAAATDEAATRQAYTECVSGLFPTQADAQSRAAACSKALQSRQLKPDEIALARLTRGIARTAQGDKALAG